MDVDKSLDELTFKVFWSDTDQAYVAKCEEYPSLSWVEEIECDAVNGIRSLVRDVLEDEGNPPTSPIPYAR